MKKSNADINRLELIITLDYLLNHTDEKHPATQQAICRHSTSFGIKYDPNNSSGNEIRRDRVGDCLNFLYEVSCEFPALLPFTLSVTDSGKYFVGQKYGMSKKDASYHIII